MKRLSSVWTAAFVLCAASISADAEEVDMAAIDCQGLLSMSAEEVVVTGAWMSGYFNGRADNTVLDTEMMPAYGAALGEYCEEHPDALLMKAVEELFVDAESQAESGDDGPVFMFVHTADDFESDLDAKSLRLINVNPQVLYFSDRPDRIAGHLSMDKYLEEWTSVPDNFNDDPPNAALSVYEPGEADNAIAVIEIENPVLDGNDIVYDYVVLEGSVPENGGTTALFIDRIGIGGGVGVGYHGVGVGVRGPGVAGWAK